MRRPLVASLVAVLVFLGSCSSGRYTYVPVTTTSADLSGAPAALHGLPPEAPRGDARLAMFGIAALRPGGISDSSLRAVHVVLALTNLSDEPWTVDPAEQRLVLGTKADPPLEATTAEVLRPIPVDIPPRSTRSIDLYFPLPLRLQGTGELPAFDVIWTVHVGPRVATQRTAFQPTRVEGPELQKRDLVTPGRQTPPEQALPGSSEANRRYRPQNPP